MIDSIQRAVRTFDSVVARAYLSLFRERNGLVAFLFHSLFRDEREIAQDLIDPLQRTTVDHFRETLAYFLEHGYRFITPGELIDGLDPGGRYALITFDDGYYNNTLALPVLEEMRVPAVFFIATENVLRNKCFWWDVQYRERKAQGMPARAVYREGVSQKTKTTEQIEAELTARFGPDAFRPRGDIDRPFTPDELRKFARHPYVHLGNHTANHAILTNYSPDEAREQIRIAQESLQAMTGVRPSLIAYPNGAHSGGVVAACGAMGLKAGFTIKPRKNVLPIDVHAAEALTLGRFAPLGDRPVEAQCRAYRSDLLLYGALRAGYLVLNRGQLN